MPLTEKGRKVMAKMKQTYGEAKGKQVFYASRNKGKISGVEGGEKSDKHMMMKLKAMKHRGKMA